MGKNRGKGSTVSAPAATASTSGVSKRSRGGAASGASLPLWRRSVDLLFAVWWIIYLFTVTFTDLHNFMAVLRGVKIPELETMDLPYPPKVLTKIYFRVRSQRIGPFISRHAAVPQ